MASMRFDHALESLYAAVGRPERWPQALSAIADYAGGTGAMLAYHDLDSNYAFLTVGRLRSDLAALYVKEHASNPGIMASRRRRPGELITVNEMVGAEAIRRSTLYADIFVPQRIADVLTLAHPMLTGRGSVGGVAITLTAKQADRSNEVTRRMQRLAPHIMRSVELSFQVAAQRQEASQVPGLLQALSSAAFLLDGRGRILLMNTLAEGVLREDDGLSRDRERRLIATSPGQRLRLESALRQALKVITSGGETFRDAIAVERITRSSRYLVLITPLGSGVAAAVGSSRTSTTACAGCRPRSQEPGSAEGNPACVPPDRSRKAGRSTRGGGFGNARGRS